MGAFNQSNNQRQRKKKKEKRENEKTKMKRLFYFLQICLLVYWSCDYLFFKDPNREKKKKTEDSVHVDLIRNGTETGVEDTTKRGGSIFNFNFLSDVGNGRNVYEYLFVQKDILKPYIKHPNQISVFYCKS